MSEAVAKVPLLEGRREWGLFLLAALLLWGLHLAWIYGKYRHFIQRPFYYTWGEVLEQRIKANDRGTYRILRVRTDEGMTLWTRTRHRGDFTYKRVRLQLLSLDRIDFWDYLKGPFVPSRIKAVAEAPESLRRRLGTAISAQHDSPETAAFYRAIFLADPLPPSLREKIAALGVSHLVALSGFHLGILWGGIFLLLRPLYRLVQERYFPWRYDLKDLGSFTLLLLGGYLWLTGMPPSLLRSYGMLLLGWSALLLGIEIVSFSFLLITGAVLLVLFPSLIVSWGFWLSMSGVFAIFLLLKWWGDLPGRIVALAVIPLGVYLLMAPVAHTLFALANPWQNLSPLLSLLFVPFYPLALGSHLLGLGGLFDGVLQWLWSLPGEESYLRQLPVEFLGFYGGLALAATRFRWAFYGLLVTAFSAMGMVFFGS